MEEIKSQRDQSTASGRFAQLYAEDENDRVEENKSDGTNIFRELSNSLSKCLTSLKKDPSGSMFIFEENLANRLPACFLNDYSPTHDSVQTCTEDVNHVDINFTFIQGILDALDQFNIHKVRLNPQERALKEEQDTWLLIETLIRLETQYIVKLRNNEIIDGVKTRLPSWKPKIDLNQENEEEEFKLRFKEHKFNKEENPGISSVGSKFNVQTPLQMVTELTNQSPKVLFPLMISRWLENIYVFDEQNYSLKQLEPIDLSHKRGPVNDFNIKSQAIAPLELLDSNLEQDTYYLPLYQSLFHNIRAGQKLQLQRDLMELDEQEIYDQIEAMLPQHNFIFGDIQDQPRFIGPDNILAQESLDKLSIRSHDSLFFDYTLDFKDTYEEYSKFYSEHAELRNQSKLNRRFKKEIGFIEWRMTHEELVQNAKDGDKFLNKETNEWYRAMYGALVGYLPSVEVLEGLSWHDLLWIYERACYYINLRNEFTKRDKKLLEQSEEPFREDKPSYKIHYSQISIRKATSLFNPDLDLIEDMSSWFSLEQTEAIEALVIQKSKNIKREELSAYQQVQLELLKSAYQAIVKGKSTPLVYKPIYFKIKEILDKKGVESRAGRDSYFREFIRVMAHLCIYMVLKCRLPKECGRIHDLIMSNYIELLIEISSSEEDELIQIIPGYCRFLIHKEQSFPLRIKFLELFKDAPNRTKKLYTAFISDDLSRDQTRFLILGLNVILTRPNNRVIDWMFESSEYFGLLEIALTQHNLEECKELLENQDYREDFKTRSNQSQKSILAKYEICYRVLREVQEWEESKDAQNYHQLKREYQEGRPPREVKLTQQSERICAMIKAFTLPNFDIVDCANEGTLLFNDEQLKIVEPRSMLGAVLCKLVNLLIDILRFSGKYNQIDSIFLQIRKIEIEQPCLACEKWITFYRETILFDCLDKDVESFLQEKKGITLTGALSKEPY